MDASDFVGEDKKLGRSWSDSDDSKTSRKTSSSISQWSSEEGDTLPPIPKIRQPLVGLRSSDEEDKEGEEDDEEKNEEGDDYNKILGTQRFIKRKSIFHPQVSLLVAFLVFLGLYTFWHHILTFIPLTSSRDWNYMYDV